ncbi:MAG: GNAT family N-acetyltransferase [Alphaproteobacteria bacterium]
MNINISKVSKDQEAAFWALLDKYSNFTDIEYYEQCFERQALGDFDLYAVSFRDVGFVGHCILNWSPRYGLFKKLGVPEVQDLNVIPEFRKRGIGRKLVEYCEDRAAERGYDVMGIGVGLDQSFGAAQRLYIKMGYVPDGFGVTYDRKPVGVGDFKPIDENLSLMMMKSLGN